MEFLMVFWAVLGLFALFGVVIIQQPNHAVVERFGKFRRVLEPGLNFIIPFVEKIRSTETTAEQIIEINIKEKNLVDLVDGSVGVEAAIFVTIKNIVAATYKITDWRKAVADKGEAAIRSALGPKTVDETVKVKENIGKTISEEIGGDLEEWGIILSKDVVIKNVNLDKNTISSTIEASRKNRFRHKNGGKEIKED